MSEHKYRVGQEVEFFPERGVEHAAKGRFIVVRLFPGERNTPCYRIKHEVDGHGKKSARTRIDTKTMLRPLRGTDGSNPVSSSAESANHRFRLHKGRERHRHGDQPPVAPAVDITNLRRLQLVLKEGRVVSDKRHLEFANSQSQLQISSELGPRSSTGYDLDSMSQNP